MISSVVGAMTKDVLIAHKNGKLPVGYSSAISVYFEKAEEKALKEDLSEMIKIFAEGSSVVAAASRLIRENNGFFQAVLSALQEDLSKTPDKSVLADTLRAFDEAGIQYKHVLTREIQQLFLHAHGTDSPIIQVAAPLSPDLFTEATFTGVPLVTVQKSLIGGVRIFYNGTVHDDSWRARLTELLTAVKHV